MKNDISQSNHYIKNVCSFQVCFMFVYNLEFYNFVCGLCAVLSSQPPALTFRYKENIISKACTARLMYLSIYIMTAALHFLQIYIRYMQANLKGTKKMPKKKNNSKAQRAQQAQIAAQNGEVIVKAKKPAKEVITYSKYVKKCPIAEFFKKNWKLVVVVAVLIAAIVAGILIGQAVGRDDEVVSGSDVSQSDIEWPINKYTLLIPKPNYDFTVVEYAEDFLTSSDSDDGTESFCILLSDFSSDDIVSYMQDLESKGFTISGPDSTLSSSGIYLYIAENEEVSMGIYIYGSSCMLAIIPGTITEDGIVQE